MYHCGDSSSKQRLLPTGCRVSHFSAQHASLGAGTTNRDEEEKIKKRQTVERKGNKLNGGCNWRQVSLDCLASLFIHTQEKHKYRLNFKIYTTDPYTWLRDVISVLIPQTLREVLFLPTHSLHPFLLGEGVLQKAIDLHKAVHIFAIR